MRRNKWFLLALLLSLALVTGCTYHSDVKEFAAPDTETAPVEQPVPQDKSAVEALKTALEKGRSDKEAQKFWYSGYVKNTILSRATTSMFDGIVVNPDGYLVNGRIAAQPYQYYRNGDKTYLRVGDYWITAKEPPLPLDVLKGFDDWLPYLDSAVQLEEDKVIGKMCTPFQIKISGEEWLKKSGSELFAPLQKELADTGRKDLEALLAQSTIKMTFWVGNDDQLLHQYQTWIIIPLPAAGYMDQEVKFTMFKYNDPGIKLNSLEEVEKYLLY